MLPAGCRAHLIWCLTTPENASASVVVASVRSGQSVPGACTVRLSTCSFGHGPCVNARCNRAPVFRSGRRPARRTTLPRKAFACPSPRPSRGSANTPAETIPPCGWSVSPYAGGAASLFHGWGSRLPDGVELLTVQYPGREDRRREELIGDMGEFLDRLSSAWAELPEVPSAFFGHSMGAMVAYELATRLDDRAGPGPPVRQRRACAWYGHGADRCTAGGVGASHRPPLRRAPRRSATTRPGPAG
ncbi:thioesterase domain-containing protein [Streptomyces sp. NPDC046977]|uniref:thioesterase II family protein n=1 Tax=Streptomyces sp. NPDC046977 TaxID=3154703 RepID=UPI0033D27506